MSKVDKGLRTCLVGVISSFSSNVIRSRIRYFQNGHKNRMLGSHSFLWSSEEIPVVFAIEERLEHSSMVFGV